MMESSNSRELTSKSNAANMSQLKNSIGKSTNEKRPQKRAFFLCEFVAVRLERYERRTQMLATKFRQQAPVFYRFSMGTNSRTLGPLYICRGRQIRLDGDSCISFQWAIQPGRRPIANKTVNMPTGIPMAR